MQVMGRFGVVGLGIALAGCLAGAPAFSGEKPVRPPVEDGSKVVITSPKDGEEVDDSFELKYELTKGAQATHVHVYLDGQYQKGFSGTPHIPLSSKWNRVTLRHPQGHQRL